MTRDCETAVLGSNPAISPAYSEVPFQGSGGSLVVTRDCETAVLGSNPAISPAYSGLPVLNGLPFGMAVHCRLSSEGRQREYKQ